MQRLALVISLLACLRGVDVHKQEETETQLQQQFFIDELFHKYGDAGVISFEGFEHLLDSLGLGRLKFTKKHSMEVHRINGTFRELHDNLELHHHDHTRRRRHAHDNAELTGPSASCLTPQDMLTMFGLAPDHAAIIDEQRFLHMCPALVYELDQRACVSLPDKSTVQKSSSAWIWASLSVLIISLVGLLGVAVVPLLHRAFFKPVLQFLIALAVGTLLGDALMHLLPHAMMSADHTTSVMRSSVAFLALAFFYVVEVGVRALLFKQNKSRMKNQDKENDNADRFEHDLMLNKSEGHVHHGSSVGSVAWMVIMGDGLHNLTDGLAIGAAFSSDVVGGLATSIAVFCHELPHEIGDLAVLLGAGMSVKRALLYNGFSSVLSFLGMAVGLWLGEYEDAAPWIYAFTAGTFLYISLADLVPELAASASQGGMMLPQLAGLLAGGGLMLGIALYEDDFADLLDSSVDRNQFQV